MFRNLSDLPLFDVNAPPFATTLQVWRLCEAEPCDWHAVLAVTVGDCDWLVLLLLWGGASELDRRAAPTAGHLTRWHRPFPGSKTPHQHAHTFCSQVTLLSECMHFICVLCK